MSCFRSKWHAQVLDPWLYPNSLRIYYLTLGFTLDKYIELLSYVAHKSEALENLSKAPLINYTDLTSALQNSNKSSTKKIWAMFSLLYLGWKWNLGSFVNSANAHYKYSKAMINRYSDMGSPSLVPLLPWKGSLSTPFSIKE